MAWGQMLDDALLVRKVLLQRPASLPVQTVMQHLHASRPHYWGTAYLEALLRLLYRWEPRRNYEASLVARKVQSRRVPFCLYCQRWVDHCRCPPTPA